MKQILIRYDNGISDHKALRYAAAAIEDGNSTGVVTFTDGTVLWFSDRAKNIALTIQNPKIEE